VKVPNSPGVWRVNRPEAKFTTVSNEFVRSRIKPGAKALALYLLSQSDGYVITQKRITAEIGMSGAALTTAFTALEADGYLVRRVVYGPRGGVLGTCYLISDQPLDQAIISEFMVMESMNLESKTMVSEGHKKTNSNQKTNVKKTNKSAAAGDAPAEPEGLFPAEEVQEKTQGPGITARDLVAAYVDAYRSAHQDTDPLQADVRKVAGTAARLLGDAAVKPQVALQAATALGRTQFTDLSGQYRRQLQAPGNQDPTRGYFRAEQKNVYVPPVGETPAEANARVERDREWLKAYNAGTATLADRPE
jgi:hypothetical protein